MVGSEKLTGGYNPTDRGNAIIFGDGAGAAVVSRRPARDRPGGLGQRRDPDQGDRYHRRRGWIYQEGQAVFRWATSAIAPVAIRAAAAAGVDLADIDVIATHQANLRIIEAIARKLISAGVRPDVRLSRDIVTTGNTSSASIPIGLDRMREAGEAVPETWCSPSRSGPASPSRARSSAAPDRGVTASPRPTHLRTAPRRRIL